MKMKFLPLSLGTAFSLSLSVMMSDSVVAQKTTTFVCQNYKGVPTTVAKTPQGDIPVIRWISTYFPTSSQERCQIVSAKFQQFYQNGSLKFLTSGKVNKQPVICVTSALGGACKEVLFTLKPGSDPKQTLQQLMDVRNNASGPLGETTERVYVDMDKYLQESTNYIDTSSDSNSSSFSDSNTPSSPPASGSSNPAW